MRKEKSGEIKYLKLVDEFIKHCGRELCRRSGRSATGTEIALIPRRALPGFRTGTGGAEDTAPRPQPQDRTE